MKLLVVEDDPSLAAQLGGALRAAGFAVDMTGNGIDAEHLGRELSFDAVVLDIGLPGKDGLAVLKSWRASGRAMPVLLLTARASWQEKVMGIDAGADDYLGKPFVMEELVARLRALVRRASGHAQSVLTCGAVSLDTRACALQIDGQPVPLTSHEYRVLSYLLHHAGRVVTRSELAEHVYDGDSDRGSNTLDVFVARLRRKLPDGFISTVRGLGWRVSEQA